MAMTCRRPELQPSIPICHGQPKTDTVKIEWQPPIEQLDPPIFYEVRYKIFTEEEKSTEWIRHKDRLEECFFKLENVPSGARCIFQVRMVNDEDVGPYSMQSDEIETVLTEARRICSGLINVQKDNAHIPVKRVPFKEDIALRNEVAKTRKFVYGEESRMPVKEKTIMILGPTGAGKSTLVDGMINYIFGVSWRDKFRLTVEKFEDDEMAVKGNQAISQTRWITCYTIHPMKGLRISTKLTIIDTPGYGDVRGIAADKNITEQLRQLFTAKDKKGILYLDAVCFVIKASDARLTKTQEYIFNSILSIFQKDIIENFCMLVTFADGKTPAVLSALKAAQLPHKQIFSFNNSALFADSGDGDSTNLSRSMLDWKMGQKGFDELFQELEKLKTKSLALSKEVLNERKRIEITVENLHDKLNVALDMSESLENLVKQMKEHDATAEKYKNFTYQLAEVNIEKTSDKNDNLNCNICKSTCHKSCWAWNYTFFISKCDVFYNDRCTQCENKCKAEAHINENFSYIYTTEKVTKTYDHIKQKYDAAAKQILTHKGLITEMQNNLEGLDIEIDTMIDDIVKGNERLNEIALRDDPLSMEDQFDLWIHEEETNRKEGWMDRVTSLKKFKKQARIHKAAKETQSQRKKSLAVEKDIGGVKSFFSGLLSKFS